MHISGNTGNHGARYFRSLSLPPSRKYALRNLYCASAMTIQVTVPDMPLTAISTMNKVSAATKLVISDTNAKHKVMLKARSGTPRLLKGDRLLGAMPVFDIAHRMRVEAYRPELPTDRIAVRITKFIRSAA
ncbi:hypothetical protein D3C85_1056080 [compost metagenome]